MIVHSVFEPAATSASPRSTSARRSPAATARRGVSRDRELRARRAAGARHAHARRRRRSSIATARHGGRRSAAAGRRRSRGGGDAGAARARRRAGQRARRSTTRRSAWIDGREAAGRDGRRRARPTWLRHAARARPGRPRTVDVRTPADVPRRAARTSSIFDRWAPRDGPATGRRCLSRRRRDAWLGRRAATRSRQQPRWAVRGRHPVLRGVDPLTLTSSARAPTTAPRLVPVARSARGTPLVSVSDAPDRRAVVLGVRRRRFEPGVRPGVSRARRQRARVARAAATSTVRRGRPGLDVVRASAIGAGDWTGRRGRAARARAAAQRSACCAHPGSTSSRRAARASTIAVNVGDPQRRTWRGRP